MFNSVADLSEEQRLRLVDAMERAITKSFKQDSAIKTGAEIRRRFEICYRIFKILRYEMRWGMIRITDKMPEYLRCELDGESWEPDQRRCWIASDGR